MAIASDFVLWQVGSCVVCRVTTNADLDKLRARLEIVGLSDAVVDVRAYFGDRLNGGSGYELLFAPHMSWADVRRRVVKI